MAVALLATSLTLSSCSGKSEASREQIATAHDDAKQMLHRTHTSPANPDTAQR